MCEWHYSLLATVIALSLSTSLWRCPTTTPLLFIGLLSVYLIRRTLVLYEDSKKTKDEKLREIFDNMKQASIHRMDGKRFSGPIAEQTTEYVTIYTERRFRFREHRILITDPGSMIDKNYPPGPSAPNAA